MPILLLSTVLHLSAQGVVVEASTHGLVDLKAPCHKYLCGLVIAVCNFGECCIFHDKKVLATSCGCIPNFAFVLFLKQIVKICEMVLLLIVVNASFTIGQF